MKKSICESSLSNIIVHNFDCIKSRIPVEVVSFSCGNLWDSAGNYWDSSIPEGIPLYITVEWL